MDEAITTSIFPRLVGSWAAGKVDPLYIAAEGKPIARLPLSGLSVGLVLLIGIFYIYNIEYPAKAKGVFIFLEALTQRPKSG